MLMHNYAANYADIYVNGDPLKSQHCCQGLKFNTVFDMKSVS